jgi:FkbM family methyltransferase
MLWSRGDGRRAPRKPERVVDRLRFAARDGLTKVVTVANGGESYKFACTNRIEVFRAKTLFVKEEGTWAWIRNTVRPGDVFYDIGANIGLYTLAAARRVGDKGRVFAFEPHAASFERLCANLLLNGVTGCTTPLSIAPNDGEGFFDFHYAGWQSGASSSQLIDRPGTTIGLRELKYGVPVDLLVERGWLPHPDVVKLDVDGREPHIISGMARLLASPRRPRSVQVEIQKGDAGGVLPLMAAMGYRMEHHHLTMSGKSKVARGKTLQEIAYNAVFVPAG